MNIDYVILLKGWWWTATDDHADGAHPGMTVQMEHTTCEDLLKDDAAVLSEFDLILLFSLVSELYIYIILFKRDVKMFVRIVKQMKSIDFENI